MLPITRILLLPWLVVTTVTTTSWAFTPSLLLLGHSSTSLTHPSHRFSSRGGDNDEISKLINKRSQIKRKKKEEPEIPATDEPIIDLNLEQLPTFKTERPVRRAGANKQDESESESESADKTKSKKENSPIVDFMADYDDENEFHIPNRMGISTRAWGDPSLNFATGKLTKRMVKMGKFVPGDIQLAHMKLLEGGITTFETAPTYGAASRSQKLSAEHILHRCIQEQGSDLPETTVLVSLGSSAWSKIPNPTKAIVASLEDSLSRLEAPVVELFCVPKSLFFPSSLLSSALAAAIESGQCNYVGVSGATSLGSLRKMKRKLSALDVTLTTNKFEFSLTNQRHGKMIDACKELGVIPLISNPLDGGLSSAVFTATNPSGGQQGGVNKFTFKQLEKLQPLHSVMETVADRVATRVRREMRDTQERYKSRYGPPPSINADITTTQVALNYVIAKGGVPLPEVNSPREAQEVLGCLGWKLNDEEVGMLEAAAALCKL